MEELREWVHLLLRWVHVIAAIAWIGHAFLFNEWDESLVPPDDEKEKERVQGELWMVHGGGFYQLVKHKAFPEVMRGPLHWFKWEAAFTWLSGLFLLSVLYYMGGGVYLIDPSVSSISVGAAIALSLGTLVGSWLIYDLLWATVGQRAPQVTTVATVALIAAVAYGLTQVFSGRAAFVHVGAMMATWMAANVWIRIIPGMTRMVGEIKPGGFLDAEHGRRAKQRSKHNNYFIYPVLFVMISNHYPSTYGHPRNWLVLWGLMAAAAGAKHLMNVKRWAPGGLAVIAAGLGMVVTAHVLPAPGAVAEEAPVATTAGGPRPITAPGRVVGTVRYDGVAPEPQVLALAGGCEALHDGPVLDDSLRIQGGRVADAFVWIDGDLSGYELPAPSGEVVVDQRGCIYHPHVVGARVGQTVVFKNSDALFHNVRSITASNEVFNEITPAAGTQFAKVFKRPEVMVQAKCDVHPWMKSFVGVVSHPFFEVTGADGSFALSGLPAGTWKLSVWQERLGTRSVEVVVPEGGEVAAEVVYPAQEGL